MIIPERLKLSEDVAKTVIYTVRRLVTLSSEVFDAQIAVRTKASIGRRAIRIRIELLYVGAAKRF